MSTPKLLTAIVDDQPIVIEGLKTLLKNEPNIHLVGGFYSGADILSYIKSNTVDLILLDITLPDINGMELCQLIKKASLSTIILILSNHTERSIIIQTIQNGASGYLLKNSAIDELRLCITEAVKGNISYSKEVMEIISRPTKNELQGTPRLTRREKEILALIAQGKTSQVIGQELFLSEIVGSNIPFSVNSLPVIDAFCEKTLPLIVTNNIIKLDLVNNSVFITRLGYHQ